MKNFVMKGMRFRKRTTLVLLRDQEGRGSCRGSGGLERQSRWVSKLLAGRWLWVSDWNYETRPGFTITDVFHKDESAEQPRPAPQHQESFGELKCRNIFIVCFLHSRIWLQGRLI